jgi:hypothetical protein
MSTSLRAHQARGRRFFDPAAATILGTTLLLYGCDRNPLAEHPSRGPDPVRAVPAAGPLSSAGAVPGALSRSAPVPGRFSTAAPEGTRPSRAVPQGLSSAAGVTQVGSRAAVEVPDLIWQQRNSGDGVIWHGLTWQHGFTPLVQVPPEWQIAGAGDFTGNGSPDLVWQNLTTGDRSIWHMDGRNWSGGYTLLPNVGTTWHIAAVGDLSGNGSPDLVWQNSVTGDRSIWRMQGTQLVDYEMLPHVPTGWWIAGVADFDRDGHVDLVWENLSTGDRSLWLMAGTVVKAFALLPQVDPDWQIAGTGDFTGNGHADLVWQNFTTGQRSIWHMHEVDFTGGFQLLDTVDPAWAIMAVRWTPPPAGAPRLETIVVSAVRSYLRIDETLALHASGRDQRGDPYPLGEVRWSSSAESVATVDGTGRAAGVTLGLATITATSGGRVGSLTIAVAGAVHTGTIAEDRTWRAADNPHVVDGRVTLVAGAVSVEPGVEVRFERGAGLDVVTGGIMSAVGTSAAPIRMVANAADPAPGHWRGVDLSAPGSELTHVIMSHCGEPGGFNACARIAAGANPRFRHVEVLHSGTRGVFLDGGGGFGDGSTHLSVHHSAGVPIEVGASHAGSLPRSGTFTGNQPDVVRIGGPDVVTTQTWPWLPIPYLVTAWITVREDAVLTLEPGTELRFEAGGPRLNMDAGSLRAIGTESAPIRMVANAGNPAAGHWQGIDISAPGSELAHVLLSHCGAAGGSHSCLRIGNGNDATLRHVEVLHSGGRGIFLDLDAGFGPGSTHVSVNHAAGVPIEVGASRAGTLPRHGSYTGNGRDVIRIVAPDVRASQTWPRLSVPYLVGVRVHVRDGATLSLEPGTLFLFESLTELAVEDGALQAPGTATEPIRMLADSEAPLPGFWRGVTLRAPGSELTHVVLSHCGEDPGMSVSACLDLERADPVLRHVQVLHSGAWGIMDQWGGGIGSGSVQVHVHHAARAPYYLHANALGSLPLTGTYVGNGRNVVHVTDPSVTTTQSWPDIDLPYVLWNGFRVRNRAQLNIEAGVRLHFGFEIASGAVVEHESALFAVGTEARPIVFTSELVNPAPGAWTGIHFLTGASAARLEHLVVEFGGRGGFPGNIRLDEQLPLDFLKDSVIRLGRNCGVSGAEWVSLNVTSEEFRNQIYANEKGEQCTDPHPVH